MIHTRHARIVTPASQRYGARWKSLPVEGSALRSAMQPRKGTIGAALFLAGIIIAAVVL